MSEPDNDDFDARVLDLFAKKIVHGIEQMGERSHAKRVAFVRVLLGVVYEIGASGEGEEWKDGVE